MNRRLLIVLLFALGLSMLAVGLGRMADPAVRSAARLAGERWYRLMLNDQQVGFMHTRSQRERNGQWKFASDLRFVITPGNAIRIRETLTFDAYPPHFLARAEQWQAASAHTVGTVVRRAQRGYQVAGAQQTGTAVADPPHGFSLGPGAWPEPTEWRPVSWTYALGDYLAFEAWLLSEAPPPGATRAVSTLDFDRRDVVPKVYRIAARNSTGYLVELAAPFDPSRIQLDRNLAPKNMTLSGIFELERVPAGAALAPRTALQAASYFIPTDRHLANHQNISALALEVQGDIAPEALWPELLAADKRTLRLRANPISGNASPRGALQETSDFPVSDPRIRKMARQAVAGAEGTEAQVAALTEFVHRYLTYREDTATSHVMALLEDAAGDCSEYADLFTTLARSVGIPSRTVFGLAYADETPPAFRFHAWNEVFVGKTWQVVDPTWNQLDVDATHIPLPQNAATTLQLLTGGGGLRFIVRDVVYR